MKILLAFPRFRYASGQPPLGISALYSYLRNKVPEVEITIFDGTFSSSKEKSFEKIIRKDFFDIVGFSVMSTMVEEVRSLSELVRRYAPMSKIVAGGPQATVDPEYFIKSGLADIAIVGEGEATLLELARNKVEPAGVRGTVYKRRGEIVYEGARDMIADLNELPVPDREIFDMKRYFGIWNSMDVVDGGFKGTSVVVSRGCPYKCSFCQPTLQKIFGRSVRKRSPKKIIDELLYLKDKFSINAFMFEDDTFLMDKKWVSDICDLMTENRLGLTWCCNVRANLCEYDILKKMYDSGLRKINMGIESASQYILDDVFKKNITVGQVKEAVRIAKEIGLFIQGYFMIGHPDETGKDIERTIRFAAGLDIDEASFSITTPLPGTFLYENDKNKIGERCESYNYYDASVYDRRHLKVSPEKIRRYKKYAYMSFYTRPKRLAKQISNIFSKNGFRKFLCKLERV